MSVEAALKRLEAAMSKIEASSSSSSSSENNLPRAVVAYDELYQSDILPFINATRALPPNEYKNIVIQYLCFFQRKFIVF